MVSAWWLLAAFFAGGFASVLLVALMFMLGRLQDHAQHLPELKTPPL
jgi:hypothetical protein